MAPGPLQVAVLGPLEVWTHEAPVDLGGARQRRLLAALVVEAGRTMHANQLASAVWADEDPPLNVDNSLRTYVSRLRRALQDAGARDPICTEPRGYRLRTDGLVVDADRLADLVASARAHREAGEPTAAVEQASQALGLWRGRPYAPFTDEAWLAADVRRLDDLRLHAVEERAEGLLALGRHEPLVAELERQCTDHPGRERLWAQLMLALYRSGRQADALRAFQAHRRALAEESGLEPGPALRDLERRIATDDRTLLNPDADGRPLRSYRLIERIGEGSFAVVWRGSQPALGRDVAIKQIRAGLANRPEFIRRFDAEAQLVARLEHPHIVPLYDYWREPDAAYLVMRWLRGGTLDERIGEGPLSLPECVRMVTHVGAALSHAHRAGVVHRDVKPANVLLDGEGNYFLGDFGIALAGFDAAESDSALSAGSPAYAAPEQLRREAVGPAADVWGLAIVAYEALSGALPFPEERTQAGLLHRQLHDPLPRLAEGRAAVPAAVDDALQRATAKDPAARTATVAELVGQLTAAAGPAAGGSAGRRTPPGAISTRHSGGVVNPYKGLRAFAEADAADFFGRARLVDRLVGRLGQPGTAGRLLAVVGPSGSGKSSVVRAGLVPAVRAGRVAGSERWFVTSMVPGAHPYEELESALARVATDRSSAWTGVLAADERGLARAVKQLLADETSELLLVVDQFEELFTLCADADERARFLDALAGAVSDPRSRLRVVLSLRADFWDRPLRHPQLASLLDETNVAVGPLAPDELERAIVEPAARVGVEFEPGLVSQIVADVADQPGALPMLQYALTELFDRQVSGLLTLDAYRRLGGVVGALARRAEELYATASAEEQESTRRLFGRLVTLGEGVEDTRRRVVRSELGDGPATEAAITRFGEARLLSFDRDPFTREPTVEVAHEALLREWPRLRSWLDEDRHGLRIQRHLTEAARAWDTRGRDPGDLYRGGRLEAAEEWATAHPGDANPLETAFLDASVAERQRAQDDLRRTNRRLRTLLAGVGVALVVALVAGGLALVQQRRARSAQGEAEAEAARRAELQASSELRRLVAESKVAAGSDMSVSLLLASEANRRADTPATRGALLSALVANPRVLGKWYGRGPYRTADLSADGSLLAVRRVDGSVELWDTATGGRRESALVVGGAAQRGSISLSPDGQLLAARDESTTIGVWDVATGRRRAELATAGSTVYMPPLRFGPGGELYYGDRTGSVWRVPSGLAGPPEAVLRDAPAEIAQLAVSRDGTTLVAVDARFNITVADLRGAAPPRTFPTGLSGATILQLALSPDGSTVAVGVGGQARALFDVVTGQALGRFTDQNNATQAFSGDGSVLTSFGSGLLVLADPRTGAVREGPFLVFDKTMLATLPSPDGSRLYAVSASDEIAVVDLVGRTKLGSPLPAEVGIRGRYSRDGRSIAVGRLDGSVAVVDPGTGGVVAVLRPPDAVPGPPAAPRLEFDFNPDATQVAVGGYAGTVTIFDVATASVVRTIPVPYEPPDSSFAVSFGPLAQGFVGQVWWSPDGTRIATAGFDAVSVFDARTGDRRFRTAGFKDLMSCSQFSPDSRFIVACSFDGTGWILDAATGQRVGPPLGIGNFEAGTAFWLPDGSGLAVSNWRESTVRILDVTTHAQRGPTYRPADAPHMPQVTPDGSTLVSSSVNGDIRLTDLATGELIGDPIPKASLDAIFILRPDGKAVVAGGSGRQIIWDVDPESWKHKACQLAGRNLTADEWTAHLPDEPYRPICPQWPSRVD